MTTLDEIEAAVSRLSADALAKFRQWFLDFDAQRWDAQFEADASSGRLDQLAEQAIEDLDSNRCKPL